jgi:hypothetical protein
MKRIYTMVKAISAMLLIVLFIAGCTKSTATPEEATTNTPDAMPAQKVFSIIASNGLSIGTATFSREEAGNAKVVLKVDRKALEGYAAPYQAMLKSSTLPTASLKPIDAATGISETYPVIATNKGLVVGHDALMFMRDLQLVIYDNENKAIVLSDIH